MNEVVIPIKLAGLGEINMPKLQAGSSIMPGKVNPVIAESTAMACAQVYLQVLLVLKNVVGGMTMCHSPMPLRWLVVPPLKRRVLILQRSVF